MLKLIAIVLALLASSSSFAVTRTTLQQAFITSKDVSVLSWGLGLTSSQTDMTAIVYPMRVTPNGELRVTGTFTGTVDLTSSKFSEAKSGEILTAIQSSNTKLDTLNTWASASVNTTVTTYIQSLTYSTTGAWIDTRDAESIVFTLEYALRSDLVAPIGASVTGYCDMSGEIFTNLPSFATQPGGWNMWSGKGDAKNEGDEANTTIPTSLTKISQVIEIKPVPASVRWRTEGIFNATQSVTYKIIRKR